jgi:hypothetical protein
LPLAIYASTDTGSGRKHLVPIDLTKVLGQGQRVMFHGKLQFKQGQGTFKARFKVYHGALRDTRPADDGFLVKLKSGTTGNLDEVIVDQEGNFAFETEGNLMDRVDPVLEVYDNGGLYLVQAQLIVASTVVVG